MQVKLFEVRDEGTHIDVLVVRLEARSEQEAYLFSRSGYGPQPLGNYTAVWRMDGGKGECTSDAFGHGNTRTLRDAHLYIEEHWDELESGAVICVEFLNGERTEPKTSDRYWTPK